MQPTLDANIGRRSYPKRTKIDRKSVRNGPWAASGGAGAVRGCFGVVPGRSEERFGMPREAPGGGSGRPGTASGRPGGRFGVVPGSSGPFPRRSGGDFWASEAVSEAISEALRSTKPIGRKNRSFFVDVGDVRTLILLHRRSVS